MRRSIQILFLCFIFIAGDSVGAVSFSDVRYRDYLFPYIDWSVENNIFEIEGENFGKKQAVTKKEFEMALGVLRCKPYLMKSLAGRSGEQYVKRSEAVRDLSYVITANMPRDARGDWDFPAGWDKFDFKDIEERDFEQEQKRLEKKIQDPDLLESKLEALKQELDSYYGSAAQVLLALKVIDDKSGHFGIPPIEGEFEGDSDPGLQRIELLEMISRSFDINTCGFDVTLDLDMDGFMNHKDFCPYIPAKSSKDGCPNRLAWGSLKQSKHGGTDQILFEVMPKLLDLGYIFKESKLLALGDLFFAAIVDPTTNRIKKRSPLFEVQD